LQRGRHSTRRSGSHHLARRKTRPRRAGGPEGVEARRARDGNPALMDEKTPRMDGKSPRVVHLRRWVSGKSPRVVHPRRWVNETSPRVNENPPRVVHPTPPMAEKPPRVNDLAWNFLSP